MLVSLVEELILSGADIIKVGLWTGSLATPNRLGKDPDQTAPRRTV